MSLMSIPSLSEVDSISDFEFSSVDFEIISKIGEGYFSDVFLVECATTGNKMVKKQTKPDRNLELIITFYNKTSVSHTV